jgi:hypothetical protein
MDPWLEPEGKSKMPVFIKCPFSYILPGDCLCVRSLLGTANSGRRKKYSLSRENFSSEVARTPQRKLSSGTSDNFLSWDTPGRISCDDQRIDGR